jgi:hypothetical protein
MKILYKPFGFIAGVIAAKVGQSVFKSLWARIDGGDPPPATGRGASEPKVIGAAALEAATLAATRTAVDRASMKSFHYLTGIWPGEREAEAKAKAKD